MTDTPTHQHHHAIRPVHPQLLQPTAPGAPPDEAPADAPQTQYEVDADAHKLVKDAAALLATHHWERGDRVGYSPLPPAIVKVGDNTIPASELLP
jgi:hypothetical protein